MLKSAIWFVTYACNLKCEYCWEVQAQRVGEFTDSQMAPWEKWLKVWTKLRPATLDITGGEPFLLPGLADLMAGLPAATKIGLTTNLTLPIADLIAKVPASRFAQVTCSIHPTQPKQSQELFLGRCLRLMALGYPVVVNMVAWPDLLHRAEAWRNHFQHHGLRFHLDRYYPLYDDVVEDRVTKAISLKMLGEDRPPLINEPESVLCSGGVDHLHVQPSGLAWRCLLEAKQRTNCLGNVFDDDFLLSKSPSICDQRRKCPNCDYDKVTAAPVGSVKA